MLIRIGDKIYDSNKEPMVVVLNRKEIESLHKIKNWHESGKELNEGVLLVGPDSLKENLELKKYLLDFSSATRVESKYEI